MKEEQWLMSSLNSPHLCHTERDLCASVTKMKTYESLT